MNITHKLILTAGLFLLSIFSLQAQTTQGTYFWLTFGRNLNVVNTQIPNFEIVITTGGAPANVTLSFTGLNTETTFYVGANLIHPYLLNETQRNAVYNTTTGKSNRSLLIKSDKPIAVYAMNFNPSSSDATNILPENVLGSEYYQISYTPCNYAGNPSGITLYDAYAVVATQDNTSVYHNGILAATLNLGEVYYRTAETDMTGAHITSNKPVAFFAANQRAAVPDCNVYGSCLLQQLPPVNTWDKTFLVPVTILPNNPNNIVRIMACKNNTNITQKGGKLRTGVPNAQTGLTNLQAGQFVELDIHLDSAGCYIEANNPVGVCAYMTNPGYQGHFTESYPTQCWVPGINQTVSNILIAPFILTVPGFIIDNQHAIVVTKTATKNKTMVSIGGAAPISLQGGSWRDHTEAGMSFYIMPLNNSLTSYLFSNQKGLIIMGYGFGSSALQTYYYLAGSAMRNLTAEFYANEISHTYLQDTTFCNKNVSFRAEIEGLHPNPGSLKWFIDFGSGEVEEVAARDQLTWSKPFENGTYPIRMWVRFENGEEKNIISTVNVKSLWIKIRNVRVE